MNVILWLIVSALSIAVPATLTTWLLAHFATRLDAQLLGHLFCAFLGILALAVPAMTMLGHKFSILTMWERWLPLYRKTLREYGLESRLASIRAIEVRPDTVELLTGKEDIVFAKLEEAALKAIREDGADVIVLGSTTMHQSHAYLASRLPVPVLNPGVVAYKMCELFLDLGLAHSKKAFPSPESLKDGAFGL